MQNRRLDGRIFRRRISVSDELAKTYLNDIKRAREERSLIDNKIEPKMNFEKGIIKPTIISFYSDFFDNNSYYYNFAQALISRCECFGANYIIEKLESKGSYKGNCLMKPGFILNKLIESKKELIWMDCDTTFKEPFKEFNNLSEDIGMATHSGDMNGIKASPIFFNYTPGAFKILREWELHATKSFELGVPELDHDALKHYVLPKLAGKYSMFLLNSNWRDFCDGKYIFNGNSVVPGKMEIHRAAMKYGDENRLLVTQNIPTIILQYTINDESDSLEHLYKWLSLFSNSCRLSINIISETDITEDPTYKKIYTESGGNVIIGNMETNNDDIIFRIYKQTEPIFGWEKSLITEESKNNIVEDGNS